MSDYYRPKRSRNMYDPLSSEPFKISRGRLDDFLKCPRCFYLDRRLGIGHPPGYPFSLNIAVDKLLKKEFDYYRSRQAPHPLFLENKIEAIPFAHSKIDEWRDSLHKGIQFLIPETNILLTGGVDDVWINPKTQELIIADYKATSKAEAVSIDADWQIGYKRQAEVYQWLFRKNDFRVSDVAYFVYCNGRTDADRFDQRLEFDISLIPYQGNADWVEPTTYELYKCLRLDSIPESGKDCDFCQYFLTVDAALKERSEE